MTVAIIAARKGSKRLKNKNIKPFCGVPLVVWSIVQAQCSKLIDRVYLSTDGDEERNPKTGRKRERAEKKYQSRRLQYTTEDRERS